MPYQLARLNGNKTHLIITPKAANPIAQEMDFETIPTAKLSIKWDERTAINTGQLSGVISFFNDGKQVFAAYIKNDLDAQAFNYGGVVDLRDSINGIAENMM